MVVLLLCSSLGSHGSTTGGDSREPNQVIVETDSSPLVKAFEFEQDIELCDW